MACIDILDVTGICTWELRKASTTSRMGMPVNIAFAGGNGCKMTIRDVKKNPNERLQTYD